MNFRQKTILYVILAPLCSILGMLSPTLLTVMFLFLGIPFLGPIIGIIFSITSIVLHIWYVISVYYDTKEIGVSSAWVLITLFFGVIGALIYYFAIHKKAEEEKVKATPSKKEVICPTCGQPATFIPQYKRYYCYNCKKYI